MIPTILKIIVNQTRITTRITNRIGCNSLTKDVAFAAKSVKTCKFGQEGIGFSAQAIWNEQIL